MLVKFGTVDRRPGSGRRSARTDENVDTVESLLLSQEDKSQNHRTVWEISREAGDPLIISFADYSHRSASQAAEQLTETHSMHALFSVCSLRDDSVITSKPTWKLKHANSILETFEYFRQISSKSIHRISSYTVSKLGPFLRHSVDSRDSRLRRNKRSVYDKDFNPGSLLVKERWTRSIL